MKVTIEATREDAEALTKHCTSGGCWETGHRLVADRIASAIRMQTPEPLVIPENLGAVVEDSDGVRYVYTDYHGNPGTTRLPWRSVGGSRFTHSEIRRNAVRVLSEGVTS